MSINGTFLVACTILAKNLSEFYIFALFFSVTLFVKSILSFSPCVCACVYVCIHCVCVCMCNSQASY